MQYQLPNGKIIYLTVEQYLSFTEQDFRDLNSLNIGDYPSSHMHGSVINGKRKPSKDVDHYNTDGLDYSPDSDELDGENFGPDDVLDEDTNFSDI